MKKLSFLVALVLAMICNVEGHPTLGETNDVIVKLSQGSLQGEKVTSDKTGGQYYSFKGIPYAQPPVGDLRFKAPTEAPTWTGIRNATFHRSICLQGTDPSSLQGTEDCLYLNVYTSQLPSSSGKNLIPVMVWIHGGRFMRGSGNTPQFSPDYLVDKGVVLVTMNYRLGALGFLSVNNSLVSSNNGLKDQRAALRWVQSNIAVFGGDKEQVTIFGQSAGGASIEHQVISPSTKGLFHRAISQSGNAINRWCYVDPSLAKQRAFNLGKLLGYTSDNEEDLVKFLKSVPAEKVTAAQLSAVTDEDVLRDINIPFQPTKETEGEDIFLADIPLNVLKSAGYEHVPYIIGFTSAEAKSFELDYLHNDSLWTDLANNMEQFVPPELGLPLGSSESLRIADEIKKMYFGDDVPTVKNIEGFINCYSDYFLVDDVRRSAKFHLKTSSTPIYVYQFTYVGRLSRSEYLQYKYPFRGAGHGDDLGYIFYYEDIQLENNSTEMSVLDRMTTIWTNFAKTGKPSEGLDIQWDALTSSNKTYLNIDTEFNSGNLDELHVKRFTMWDQIFASIDD